VDHKEELMVEQDNQEAVSVGNGTESVASVPKKVEQHKTEEELIEEAIINGDTQKV